MPVCRLAPVPYQGQAGMPVLLLVTQRVDCILARRA